jgi:hypothetical protein
MNRVISSAIRKKRGVAALAQFSAAWARILKYPVLILVPMGLSLILIIPMSLVNPATMVPAFGAGISLLMLIALFAAPAVAGGYNAMVGSAVEGRGATFEAFREGSGKFYGRIVGGFLLMALIGGVFAYRGWSNAWMSGRVPTGGLLASMVTSALSAFSHVWLAALVARDRGILDTTSAAWGSLVARLNEYLPVIAVAVIAPYLLRFIGPSYSGPWSGNGMFVMRPAMAALALVSSVATSAVQAVVRVAFFGIFMGAATEASSPR